MHKELLQPRTQWIHTEKGDSSIRTASYHLWTECDSKFTQGTLFIRVTWVIRVGDYSQGMLDFCNLEDQFGTGRNATIYT